MPQIENLKTANFSRRTLDREQLEYTGKQLDNSAKQLLIYGIILFFTVGTLSSVGYLAVKQLRKD